MKTLPAIGNIEGIDGKHSASYKDKSNALSKFFSGVFMHEDPNIVPSFHIDKSGDASLSSITITPSMVFEKLASLKTGIS